MVFSEEKLSDFKEDFLRLSEIYHKEVGTWEDILPNVDFEAYESIGDTAKFYTARKEGELVGFCSYFLNNHIHYSDSFQAAMDLIFVHPEHRGIGAKLVIYTEKELKKIGVQVVYQHSSLKMKLGKFFKRLGYEEINIEYAKRLDL